MAPGPRVSDADFVFGLFFDSGPVSIGVANIAKQRGLSEKTVVGRIRGIKKRNPGFQLQGTTKGSALTSRAEDADIQVATPKATPAIASSKKAAKSSGKPNASSINTDTHMRTRSASRAMHEDSDSEDDQEQQSTSKSQASKSIAVRKTKDALVTSSNETKSKAGSIAKTKQSKEDESNKENEAEHDKPTPKTRGARKSVGAELEETPLELPKPAPRGRNASRARSVIAEKELVKSKEEKIKTTETEDRESTNLAEEDQMIESVEAPDADFIQKTKTTGFVNKLLVETSEDIITGTKRKRTPSPVQEEHLQEHLDDPSNIHAASILTLPDSPSKQPPAKKQKIDIDEMLYEKTITTDVTSERQTEDISVQEESPIGAEVNVQDFASISGDDRRNDDPDSMQDDTETEAVIPGRFPWMSWDPDAVPDPSSSEGLGRVVSNEYARAWRERNAAAKAEQQEIAT